jgi:hypothetical protein
MVDHVHPGLPDLLERLPVRDLVHLDDRSRTAPARSPTSAALAVHAADRPIAAAAVVITIPIIIFVLFFQRRIVAGLTSGAVKGYKEKEPHG